MASWQDSCGLHLAGLLSSSLSPVAHLLLGVGCALGGALVGSSVGRRVGATLARHLHSSPLAVVDRVLGALVRAALGALACWIVATLVLALGPPGWGSVVRGSALLSGPAGSLPVAEGVFQDVTGALRAAAPEDLAALVPAAAAGAPTAAVIDKVDRRVVAGVFLVTVEGCGRSIPGGRSVAGTGFAAGADGLVITNAHVVRNGGAIFVHPPSGELAARVVVLDRRADLAVLRVDGLSAPLLPLARADASNGTAAVFVGYPGGGPQLAVGAVVRQRLLVPDPGLSDGLGLHVAYRLDAPIRHGDSGSPLLNSRGQVIGVVNALSGVDTASGYAITLDELTPDLRAALTATRTVAAACPT